jgi:hypothetical protein
MLIGLACSAILLANQAFHLNDVLWMLQPACYHLLTVGWLTQLIAGVAFWLFPTHSRELPRGNPRLMWAAYTALNLGLLLRIVAEPLHTANPSRLLAYTLVASGLLQMVAIWMIILVLWPRVRGRASRSVES